jgi:hypothetical protein
MAAIPENARYGVKSILTFTACYTDIKVTRNILFSHGSKR